jgi:hypothetical protein
VIRHLTAAAILSAGFTSVVFAETVTTDNIISHINETNVLDMMHGIVEEFSCGEDATDKDRQFCHGNIKIGQFGISVLAKTEPKTKSVTYAGLMMASPEMSDTNGQAMSGSFLVLVARLIATFNPELPQDKRTKAIEKLIKGMDKDTNELRIGNWVYGCGRSIFLAFSVERADDRHKD